MATNSNIAIALNAAETAARSLGYKKLKVKQTEVLVNLIVRNNAFAALPTGYGKSLLELQKPSVVSKTPSTHSVAPDRINHSPESRLQ